MPEVLDTFGVVTQVPQWAMCTGSVFTSHALR
jgi:hypothetical protein